MSSQHFVLFSLAVTRSREQETPPPCPLSALAVPTPAWPRGEWDEWMHRVSCPPNVELKDHGGTTTHLERVAISEFGPLEIVTNGSMVAIISQSQFFGCGIHATPCQSMPCPFEELCVLPAQHAFQFDWLGHGGNERGHVISLTYNDDYLALH